MANLFRSHGDELRGTIDYDDRPIAFSDKWKYRSTSTSGNVATARISTCNGDVDVEATYSPRYLHLTWPDKYDNSGNPIKDGDEADGDDRKSEDRKSEEGKNREGCISRILLAPFRMLL